MGRRKQSKWWHGQSQQQMAPSHVPLHKQEELFVSTRQQELLDLVEMAGFVLPHQFQQWRRYFLDEKNFLAEAEHWLSLRLQGRFPKIEDDVDKGLMTKPGITPYRPSSWQKANSGWSDDDDYWTAWMGWSGSSKYTHPILPLTPKLPAPSGLCGAELVVM